MAQRALGLFVPQGLVGATQAADSSRQAADVRWMGTVRANAESTTINLLGDVAAVVKAAPGGAAAAGSAGRDACLAACRAPTQA